MAVRGTDVDGALVRVCDLAGRPRGTGFLADADGTMVTSHEAVDGLARLVLHAPGDQVCLVEAEAITVLPEAGLALVATEGLALPPLPIAPGGPAHPERRVRVRLPQWTEGVVLGTASVTYTATDRFHLLEEVYELALDGADLSRVAPQASGAPLIDAATGAVLGVVATALHSGHRAAGFAVPLRAGTGCGAAAGPLAELLARNAATVSAYGPHLNLAGALQLTGTSVGSAAGPGQWREPVDRPEVADALRDFMALPGESAPLVLGLVGDPGSGRSTVLAELAGRRARGPAPAPTVWLRGAELRPGDGGIKDAVERSLRTAARIVGAAAGRGGADGGDPPLASPDAVADLARAAGRPLLILLDAPEEMPPVLAHALADWAAGTASWLRDGGVRLIVGCRPEFWEQLGALLPAGLAHAPGGPVRGLPPCLRLGDLTGVQAARARVRHGLPPDALAPADAAHPLALRLLSEVRASLPEAMAMAGGPPTRAEIFSAHLDLVCLRIAVRLAAGAEPPLRGGGVRRLAARVAGQAHEAARRCLGPGQGELDRESFEDLFPWRTGWASAVLTEGLLVPTGAGYRFAHEESADWLQSLHLDLDAALHALVHRWFADDPSETGPGGPAGGSGGGPSSGRSGGPAGGYGGATASAAPRGYADGSSGGPPGSGPGGSAGGFGGGSAGGSGGGPGAGRSGGPASGYGGATSGAAPRGHADGPSGGPPGSDPGGPAGTSEGGPTVPWSVGPSSRYPGAAPAGASDGQDAPVRLPSRPPAAHAGQPPPVPPAPPVAPASGPRSLPVPRHRLGPVLQAMLLSHPDPLTQHLRRLIHALDHQAGVPTRHAGDAARPRAHRRPADDDLDTDTVPNPRSRRRPQPQPPALTPAEAAEPAESDSDLDTATVRTPRSRRDPLPAADSTTAPTPRSRRDPLPTTVPSALTAPAAEAESGASARRGDAVWWAAHLVGETLTRIGDARHYRGVLRLLAERVAVRSVERGGFTPEGLGGLGEFGPGFWRRVPLPLGERLELLRLLLPADRPPVPGEPADPETRFLPAVAELLREAPGEALTAVCRWFDDDRPLQSAPGDDGPRLTVASAAQALLHTHRRLAVDDLTDALVAAAHPGADEVLAALAEDEPSAVCRAVDRWAHDPRPDRHVAAASYGRRAAPFARSEADRELLRYAALAILARPGDCTLHGAALGLLVRDPATRSRHLDAALERFAAGDPQVPAAALAAAFRTHPEPVLTAFQARLRAPAADAAEVLEELAGVTAPALARRAAALAEDHLRRHPESAADVVRYLDLRLEQGPAARAVLLPLTTMLLRDHPPQVRRTLLPLLAAPGSHLSRPLRQELLDLALSTERDPTVLDALLAAASDGCGRRPPVLTRDLVHRIGLLLGRTPEGAAQFDRRVVELAHACPAFARLVREWLDTGGTWDAVIGPSARRRLESVA